MDEMEYVRILRDLREDADKTQSQIAEVLGTSQTMYARYERGANELAIPQGWPGWWHFQFIRLEECLYE